MIGIKSSKMGIIFRMDDFYILYVSSAGDNLVEQKQICIIIFFNLLGLKLDTYFGELATLIIRKGEHFTSVLYLIYLNI